MRQGTMRAPLAERGDDFYETPACATRALLRSGVRDGIGSIWEPCAGRGAIARELIAAGHRVVAQDLVAHDGADGYVVPRIDFLMERRAPDGVAAIMTNPPYKLADAFVRHGRDLVETVVVLLRLAALEGAGRSDLIDGRLDEILVGIERLPMMHRDGWAGPKTDSGGVPFAWYVFRRTPAKPARLRRISWRAS